MKTTPYEDLPFLPFLVADTVCGIPYDGREYSKGLVTAAEIAKMRQLQDAMTPVHIDEFCILCDKKCRLAYERKCDWFMKIVKSKSNAGRDQLNIYTFHWLTAYLTNPDSMRRAAGVPEMSWPSSVLHKKND